MSAPIDINGWELLASLFVCVFWGVLWGSFVMQQANGRCAKAKHAMDGDNSVHEVPH